MTNNDLYFDTKLNYKIISLSGDKHSNQLDHSFIVPFPVFILCHAGSAKVQFNAENLTLHKDSLLCIYPNVALKPIEVSEDFQGIALAFSQEAVIDSTTGFKIEYFANIFVTPLKKLDNPLERNIISNLFDTLHTYSLLEKRFERNTDFVYGNVRNIILTLAEFTHKNAEKRFSANTFSTTDNYFREFMKLLSQHSKTQHNVAFYADKLCITPKYLNEICRKKTQKTAKEVITRAVIAQIKSALMVSGSSVQRIAYEFNFCDQSSFGKYFKKAVGLAPMAFRNKHNDTPEE